MRTSSRALWQAQKRILSLMNRFIKMVNRFVRQVCDAGHSRRTDPTASNAAFVATFFTKGENEADDHR